MRQLRRFATRARVHPIPGTCHSQLISVPYPYMTCCTSPSSSKLFMPLKGSSTTHQVSQAVLSGYSLPRMCTGWPLEKVPEEFMLCRWTCAHSIIGGEPGQSSAGNSPTRLQRKTAPSHAAAHAPRPLRSCLHRRDRCAKSADASSAPCHACSQAGQCHCPRGLCN